MKVDGDRIYEQVALAIAEINKQKLVSVIHERQYKNVQKYIMSGALMAILNGNVSVYSISDNTLYHIIRILNYEKRLDLKLDEIFKEEEIVSANTQVFGMSESADKTLRFKNFTSNGDENSPEWLGYMTYGEIANAFQTNKITYKIEMQRQGTLVKINGIPFMKPTIYPETIRAIYESMINEEYMADMITLNLAHTGKEKYYEDGNNIEIEIKNNNEVVIADGAHRVRAISNVVTSHPHLANKRMPVCLKNLTPEKTRAFIGQVAKANRLTNEEAFDINSDVNRLIADLNMFKNKKNNWLYKGITETITDDTVVLASTFRDGLIYGDWDDLLASADSDVFKIKEEIANLYTMVHQFGNGTLDNDILMDQSFLMGLLITGKEMFVSDGYIDSKKIEAIIKFVEKRNNFKQEYIYNIPMMPGERRKFTNKYKRLCNV